MAEKFVAKASEMTDGDRRIVFVGDNEIGVFRHEGKYYAYSNFCLHQGGPACEGLTIAKVEERLRPDKTSQGLYFSETEMHFVCPWHGMEYDMKTGECVSDRKMKLKKYQVARKRGRGVCRRLRPPSSRRAQVPPRPAKLKAAATRTVAPKPKTPQTGLSADAIKLATEIEHGLQEERRRDLRRGDAGADGRAVPGLRGAGRERQPITRRSRKARWSARPASW